MNSNRPTTNLSDELNKNFLFNINQNWLMGFIEAGYVRININNKNRLKDSLI